MPGKVTGKNAVPATPDTGPFQAWVPSGAQAGGRLGPPAPGVESASPVRRWEPLGSFSGPNSVPARPLAPPPHPSLQNPLHARRANVAFFFNPCGAAVSWKTVRDAFGEGSWDGCPPPRLKLARLLRAPHAPPRGLPTQPELLAVAEARGPCWPAHLGKPFPSVSSAGG